MSADLTVPPLPVVATLYRWSGAYNPEQRVSVYYTGERDHKLLGYNGPDYLVRKADADAAIASLQARLDAAERDAARLREDCAEAYQVMGAAMLAPVCVYTEDDVSRALDNISAAANGDTRPHADLLPWPRAATQEKP